jgi:signal transduction histidine kinase
VPKQEVVNNLYRTVNELFKVTCGIEESMRIQITFVTDENFLLHRRRALRLLELMEQHEKSWESCTSSVRPTTPFARATPFRGALYRPVDRSHAGVLRSTEFLANSLLRSLVLLLMSPRRSLRLPIILAIVMIALLVFLTVGWVLLSLFGALADTRFAGLNWTLLSVGTVFMAALLAGVIIYLVFSIKTINFNRRQSNFLDSVTHEFKSPIASMKLCLQTLSRRQVSNEERASFHQYMLEDLDRLDLLVNQVLDAGRLDTVPLEDETDEVSLADVLQECAETVCSRYRVPLETVRLEVEPCRVRARQLDLEMVFRNLIDNAVKYAGEQPEVEVVLKHRSSGNVMIQIRDNGKGIPHSLRRKVFERFLRLGSELERERPGTGLGLYIVRTLVRRLGGHVRVRDRESGTGALFEVDLPGKLIIDEEPQPPESNQQPATPELT